MMLRLLISLTVVLSPALAQAGGYGYNYSSYGYSTYAPYSYSTYVPYTYQWWPGGYWQGAYYAPNYYRTYYPSYDYAVKYASVPLFSAGAAAAVPAATIPTQPAAPVTAMPRPVQAPAPASASAPAETVNKALLDALLQLRQDVNDLKRQKTSQPPEAIPVPGSAKGAKAEPVTLRGIVQAKCAACHDAAAAKKNGKGWVALADGKLREWSDHDWRLVFRKVIDRGEMPPADNPHGIPPLTEAEVNVFKDAMNKD